MLKIFDEFLSSLYNDKSFERNTIFSIVEIDTEKKSSKKQREHLVLLAMVDYYIKVGKPVGSSTLKEQGFPDLSSATIRNYFATLEKKGFLHQHHTSGGRLPTDRAYRVFAEHVLEERKKGTEMPSLFAAQEEEAKEQHMALFLQKVGQNLSDLTGCATFLSAPRFDHDYIVDCNLVHVDEKRCVSLLITQFGLIYTEVVHLPIPLSKKTLEKVKEYFQARILQKEPKKEHLTKEELSLANHLYQEVMARYFVSYTNFSQEDVYKTGFSQMLRYPEFQEAQALTGSLLLFENTQALRALVRQCLKAEGPKFWIGEDLGTFVDAAANCSIIASSYLIGQKPVGAIGIIAPMRIDYEKMFTLIEQASEEISSFLTNTLYKFKVTYRSPKGKLQQVTEQERFLLSQKKPALK